MWASNNNRVDTMDKNDGTSSDSEDIQEEISIGKFRRHSSAVVGGLTGLNGIHRRPAELYLIRINPACRIVWFYMLQHNIPHILIDVDFSKGEKQLPEGIQKQPHRDVPILIDGEFVVFDGPAILAYLASNYTDYAGYGNTLPSRLLTESLISWANSELHRAVGYCYIYPQFLEKFALPNERANDVLIESGLKQLSRHLEILEKAYLSNSKHYLTGNRITVADSYIATILVQAEWSGTKFGMWPLVDKWLSRVKDQVHWDSVHVTHNMYLKDLERCALFE